MGYIGSSAIKRVFRNKSIYTIFAVQIMIAVLIISVVSSIATSLAREYKNLLEDRASNVFYFTTHANIRPDDLTGLMQGGISALLTSFSMEHYEHLSEHFADINVCLAMRTVVTVNPMAETSFVVFSTTNEFFEFALPTNQDLDLNNANIIYANPQFLHQLAEGIALAPSFFDMTMPNLLYVNTADNSITLTNGEVFQVKPIQSIIADERAQIFFDDNLWDREDFTHSISEVVIAPINFTLGGISRVILAIEFADGSIDGETLLSITDFLSTDLGVEVRFDSLFQRFSVQTDEMAAVLSTVNMILFFCLVVVFIGFVGLVIILYERRKRNIAMSMVCGAFQGQIMAEVLLEVGFVVMSSVGIATIISVIIQNTLINFREFPFYANYGFISIIILSAVVISVIVVAVPLVQIRKTNIPITLANTN